MSCSSRAAASLLTALLAACEVRAAPKRQLDPEPDARRQCAVMDSHADSPGITRTLCQIWRSSDAWAAEGSAAQARAPRPSYTKLLSADSVPQLLQVLPLASSPSPLPECVRCTG